VVLALAGTLAVACSSAKGLHAVTPHASVPTAPAQTTTTNPYAVPAVIDAAYVNRVLAALDAADGDITRMALNHQASLDELTNRLKAIYDDPGVSLEVDLLTQDAARNFPGVLPNPGNQRTLVSDLISAGPSCIFAHVSRDYSQVVESPDPQLTDQWVGLVPLDQTRDPNHRNTTGWLYVYSGFEPDRSIPKNPCGAS
jgi:hypothetical protein